MVSHDQNGGNSADRLTRTRRNALKGLGIAGVGLLAGCSGDGGDGGGDGGDGGSDGGTDGGDGGGDGGDGGGDGGDGGTDFPSQDLRAIIPFGTGGGFDFYVRTLAQYLPENLPNDVDVVAENVTGSTGRIAANEVFSSDNPHTFMLLHGDAFARAQAFEGTEFDLTEMTIYPQVAVGKNSIFLGEDSSIETWDDYVQGMKDQEITFCTTGAADDPLSTGTFVNIQIGENTGLWTIDDVMNCPRLSYEGQGEAFTAIQRGEADARVTSFSSGYQYSEQSGTYPLVHLDTESPSVSPDLQNLNDLGNIEDPQTIADTTASPFRIFAGPPSVGDQQAEIMRQAITDTIQSDGFQSDAEEAARPIIYEDGDRATEIIQTLIETYEGQKDLFEPYLSY